MELPNKTAVQRTRSPRARASTTDEEINYGGVSAEILAQLGDASTVVKLSVRDCSVDSVTVYSDRAEVVRIVEFDAPASGLCDLIVEGVTIKAHERSVRVQSADDKDKKKRKKRRKAKTDDNAEAEEADSHDAQPTDEPAACTILEVSTERSQTDAAKKSDAVKAQEAKIEEIDERVAVLNRAKGVVEEQRQWLRDYSAALVQPYNDKAPMPIDVANNFLTLLGEKAHEFGAAVAEKQAEIAKLATERQAATQTIYELTALEGASGKRCYNVTVGLFCTQPGKVSLRLSYMVSGAHWQSSYDCRVISPEEKLMQLIYYGEVTNNTDEHWEQARISLSTAEPHSGGEPPAMSTLHVDFGYSAPTHYKSKQRSRGPPQMQQQQQQQQFIQSNMMLEANPLFAAADESNEFLLDVEVETAQINDSPSTASFSIAGRKTIPSDNKVHKVTIAVNALSDVKFTHTAIARVGKVFLRGTTVNKSAGPLLAGDCSIFIEGSFIATNQLKTVLPGQEFSVFLGVDSNVSLKVFPDKAKEKEVGMWSKSRVEDKKRRFVLKNHRPDDIVVSLFEQLPLSKQDAIKVKLIEPSPDLLEKKKSNVILNEFNNIRFTVPLKKGEEQEIHFHYELSYPSDKTVVIQSAH